ncbi:protein transport protein Sec24B-like isoform X2 [Protopterus annectens]|uniref:protein transport protein Sec24B-like isoform X2 n=1 Tax=Protopterus annectens TaxID=7888 RepID=UPI001CFA1BE0|nr:protein transport protein Sec24B-like isoform X2 [Protopterus annectens]
MSASRFGSNELNGMPVPKGGAAASQHSQNGPAPNKMQLASGFGPSQNFTVHPIRHSQAPYSGAPPSKNQYGTNYYQGGLQMTAGDIRQPQPNVGPTSMGLYQGPPQAYVRTPLQPEPMATYLGSNPGTVGVHPLYQTGTSLPSSYQPVGGSYGSNTSYYATTPGSVQGLPSQPGQYVPSASLGDTHPVPLSSVPVSQYGQMFSSPAQSAAGQLPTGMLPTAVPSVTQSLRPQQGPLAYHSGSQSVSAAVSSTPVSINSSISASVATVTNQGYTAASVTGLMNQNIQFTKPNVGPPPSLPTSAVVPGPPSTNSVSATTYLSSAAGMQYGCVANNGTSCAPTPLSSSSDDEDEEEEEAGIDSSSTSSASPVPNSYDALEGGGYTEQPPVSSSAITPPASQTSNMAKPFGYGYPALQPGYQNTPSPQAHSNLLSSNVGPSGFQQSIQPYSNTDQLSASLGGLSLHQSQQPEGLRPVNLIQDRNILPHAPVIPVVPNLNPQMKKLNCNPDLFRCTLTNIPQTQGLLNKAKLPLGLLLHPFRDLTLPVITSSTIVRCRSCRTYINPFVSFLDQKRWKCNICYRVNDVPEEFMYNPLTRSYGEPHKRPEVQNATVEFIASSDYMLRPPQPAVYLFILDVSHNAVESGYLNTFSQSLLETLDKLPGDSRTKIGFVTFDSTVHFYNLQEGLSQPQMLIVSDIDDVFLPTPDSLLVNLHESRELITDLLKALPNMFCSTRETHSALGPALQASFKLLSPTGGRMSVFQTQLPSLGAGLLHSREDPNQRSSTKGIQHLGPATDFYKKLALDCSGQQIAVDLFLLSSQYSDLASIACISKYSAGCIYYYPSFHHIHNVSQTERLQKDLKRYLTRKIGFEAVMRIRCTRGLSIHTFHGNFFVRSTDLLALANINPDSGYAVQMSVDESLADTSLACFQAALLYTSSKGERRIRVHTLCLPVVHSLADVYAGADVQAITCLLASMGVDRSVTASLSDARDALVNAAIDSLSAYRSTVSNLQQSALIAPHSLRLFPLYILALLKQKAFRTGTSTRLDERVFDMCEMKCQPVAHLMRLIHPSLYRIDRLSDEASIHVNDKVVPQPPLQQLSSEKLTRDGAFLMDCGVVLYLWVGKNCKEAFISEVLGYPNYAALPMKLTQLPELDNPLSEKTRAFVSWLRENRCLYPVLHVIKDEAPAKTEFFQHLIEDRMDSGLSYYEFLLHIQQQITK